MRSPGIVGPHIRGRAGRRRAGRPAGRGWIVSWPLWYALFLGTYGFPPRGPRRPRPLRPRRPELGESRDHHTRSADPRQGPHRRGGGGAQLAARRPGHPPQGRPSHGYLHRDPPRPRADPRRPHAGRPGARHLPLLQRLPRPEPRRRGRGQPRGLAVKFYLPDGSATDLVCQSWPVFPAGTPEGFLGLLRSQAEGEEATERFLAANPDIAEAVGKVGACRPPTSRRSPGPRWRSTR